MDAGRRRTVLDPRGERCEREADVRQGRGSPPFCASAPRSSSRCAPLAHASSTLAHAGVFPIVVGAPTGAMPSHAWPRLLKRCALLCVTSCPLYLHNFTARAVCCPINNVLTGFRECLARRRTRARRRPRTTSCSPRTSTPSSRAPRCRPSLGALLFWGIPALTHVPLRLAICPVMSTGNPSHTGLCSHSSKSVCCKGCSAAACRNLSRMIHSFRRCDIEIFSRPCATNKAT